MGNNLGYSAEELEQELERLLPLLDVSKKELQDVLDESRSDVKDMAATSSISSNDPYLIAAVVFSHLILYFRRDLIDAIATAIERNNHKIADDLRHEIQENS